MPDRALFESLRLELLRGGTANLYVERTLRELADHYEDLERASLASGCTGEEAAQRSAAALGVLPALPVLYAAGRSDGIARWGGAIGVALLLVGSLYSALAWVIMAG